MQIIDFEDGTVRFERRRKTRGIKAGGSKLDQGYRMSIK